MHLRRKKAELWQAVWQRRIRAPAAKLSPCHGSAASIIDTTCRLTRQSNQLSTKSNMTATWSEPADAVRNALPFSAIGGDTSRSALYELPKCGRWRSPVAQRPSPFLVQLDATDERLFCLYTGTAFSMEAGLTCSRRGMSGVRARARSCGERTPYSCMERFLKPSLRAGDPA